MKGLVLFDYDGTLVDERDEIYVPTLKTKKAIELLQDKDYVCVLATGRAQSYIPKGARDLSLDGYITSNGACVQIHGKELYHDVFEQEELSELLQDFETYDINFILENSQHCFVKDLKDPNYIHFLDNFHTPKDNFIAYTNYEQAHNKIEKITLIFKDDAHLQAYCPIAKKKYVVGFHRNCNTFDIAKPHVNKGTGVKALLAKCNIPMEETYAFGDGDNDVELLASVTHGIAMGLHDELLDPVASMVTGTVKEEGIYEALKKLEVI